MRDLHDEEGRVAAEAAERHAGITSGAGMLRRAGRLSARPVLLSNGRLETRRAGRTCSREEYSPARDGERDFGRRGVEAARVRIRRGSVQTEKARLPIVAHGGGWA